MKNFELDEIEKTFNKCKTFFNKLEYAYKVQGIVVPVLLKDVMKDVNNQINKIEGESDVKTK